MFKAFKEQDIQRHTIFFNQKEFENKHRESTILITGAAGTIGREISILLNKSKVKKIIFFDQSEIGLHNLKEDLSILNQNNGKLIFILGSIRDKIKIRHVLKKNHVNLIIHTAAYKHVAILEEDLYEAIRTNVEGTINLYEESIKNNVSDFVFISSDKAVKPISLMGMSKKIAEIYLDSSKNSSDVTTKIIRCGNVINSSGSILPTFMNQIKNTKSINLKSETATRYFIYADVVATSILNIVSSDLNGKFVLEMGNSIKIKQLAKDMIENSKFKNININLTHLNKGEKVYESLKEDYEAYKSTKDNAIKIIEDHRKKPFSYVKEILELVEQNKKMNLSKVKMGLHTLCNKNSSLK